MVRHPLVGRIVHAYGEVESRNKTGARYEKKETAKGPAEPGANE